MIDEKKLLADLEDEIRLIPPIEENRDMFYFYSGWNTVVVGLRCLVNNQPKLSLENKTSDKWIPYDNKHEKPSKVGRYRVTELDFLMTRIVNFRFWNGYRFEGCEEIIAWQPNPKPYKGEWKNEID